MVYAANAGVWWLFTLTSNADSVGGTNHVIKTFVSSGPDLATALWAAGADSPGAPAGTSGFMGGGRALSVAYLNNAPTDVIHAEVAMASDGQDGFTDHIRAKLTKTSVAWESWDTHDEPAATWTLPRATSLGVSTSKFIHTAGPILQQEVDANARKSTNPDTGSTWTSGFSPVSVIDNSMLHENNALGFAALPNDAMLAVYDNGGGISTCYPSCGIGAPEPNLTNLGFKKSNADGSWPGVTVASQTGGDGKVFAADAMIHQNDWSLVPVTTSSIYAFRKNTNGTGVDGASYSASSNTWVPLSSPPPDFGAGQAFKNGAGLFGATDGANVWLFAVNNNASNSILFTKYDGSSWTAWTALAGTDAGTHSRNFLAGFPRVANNQIGLIWTEGTGPYSIMATSLPTGAGGPPASSSSSSSAASSSSSSLASSSSSTPPPASSSSTASSSSASSTAPVILTFKVTYIDRSTATGKQVWPGDTVTISATDSPPQLWWAWYKSMDGGAGALLTSGQGAIPNEVFTVPADGAGHAYKLTLNVSDGTTTAQRSFSMTAIAKPTTSSSSSAPPSSSSSSSSSSSAVSSSSSVASQSSSSFSSSSSTSSSSVASSSTSSVAQLPSGTLARPSFTAGWATFGQALPQGWAIDGVQVGSLPTQTDVKNRWPDGSIKFAVVTVNIPSAGTYAMTAATNPGGTFTPVIPQTSVTLTLGSTLYTATLPGSAGSDMWLSGPLVREWRSTIAPVGPGGPHPFLRVLFDTRVYNDGKAHVSYTFENVLNVAGAMPVTYDVSINANGTTLFSQSALLQYYLTRWRKAYDLNFTPSTVTPDMTPFNVSKAIPPINAVVALDPRVDSPTGSTYGPMGPGAVDPVMGAHGGRAELAPLPDWTARYLAKKNPTQGKFVMANGDLSGSWQIHVREPETSTSGVGPEKLVSMDQKPGFWLDDRHSSGSDQIQGGPVGAHEYGSPGTGQSPLVTSNAHVPDLAFVPYLLTGDRYYAEEMAFWANESMLATNGHGAQGLLTGNEVRGVGWTLRNMAEAAAYYPDSSPVKAYLAQKVVNNLNWLDSFAKGLKTAGNPLWIVYAWTKYDRPEGPEYFTHWENNYAAYGIDRAIKLGFATDNAYRDAANDLQLKFFTSDPDYPRLEGAPYAIPYGTLNGSTVTFFTTMAQFKPGAVANHRDFAGYYGPEARISIMEARERGGAGAQGAYDYLWPFIGTGTSYCSTNGTSNEPFLACRAGFALDPYPS